jgi:hypothetical protein
MALKFFRVPLLNTPQRSQLSLSGVDYIFINRWFSGMNLWVFSLLSADDESILINDMPLITGADLLEQWEFLGIPGKMICLTAGDQGAPPTFDNLGGAANLFYITNE